MKINKFNSVFKLKKLVVSGSSLTNLKCVIDALLMRFSRKYLLHKIKKCRDDPDIINQEVIFLGNVWG